MTDLPPLPDLTAGTYRHYKGGIYKLIDLARHSETLEPLVIYEDDKRQLWARPAAMWTETVDGHLRFELVISAGRHPAG